MARRHRIVVVGGGFGGLAFVKSLTAVPVDIVMIDANNFHTFQPLLYQVATAGLDADDIAHPIRGIMSKRALTDVRLGRVVDVDIANKAVVLDEGPSVEYDELVLAVGAVSETYGIPGVEEFGHGLKTLHDAQVLRTHVLRQFERAAVNPTLVDDGALNIVIAGGGPTGVELAGGMMELFTKVLTKDFPTLDIRRARVVLVEPADRLLASFSPKLSGRALRTLSARGIEVVLGAGVQATDGKTVTLTNGTSLPIGTLAWTAGVTAHPLAQSIAQQVGHEVLTRGNRLRVDEHLRLLGQPDIFVIGDLAGTTDSNGDLLPQLAPVAIQSGQYVARYITARYTNDHVPAFQYRDKGAMATIGRNAAVAELQNGLQLSGFPGWVAWLALHLVMLVGFRNRLNVLMNWAWNYLTYDRASRLIVDQPDPPQHQ